MQPLKNACGSHVAVSINRVRRKKNVPNEKSRHSKKTEVASLISGGGK